jgi:hypothetical protein
MKSIMLMSLLINSTAVALIGTVLMLTDRLHAEPACANSPKRIGGCFTVHGRMTSCTSVPSVRIWMMGTHRVLGIEDANGDPAGEKLLPEKLLQPMLTGTPCTKAAFGDFTVCPLTPQQPGVMQRACVVSAKKILINENW